MAAGDTELLEVLVDSMAESLDGISASIVVIVSEPFRLGVGRGPMLSLAGSQTKTAVVPLETGMIWVLPPELTMESSVRVMILCMQDISVMQLYQFLGRRIYRCWCRLHHLDICELKCVRRLMYRRESYNKSERSALMILELGCLNIRHGTRLALANLVIETVSLRSGKREQVRGIPFAK